MAGNFTFPTEAAAENGFRVADLVNVTWDVVAPLVSIYETCGSNDRALEGEAVYLICPFCFFSDNLTIPIRENNQQV